MNAQPKFLDSHGAPILKRRKRPHALSRWQRALFTALIALGGPLLFIGAVTQMDLANQVKGVLKIANGGTGTSSTLTGLMRGHASAMTAAELSGVVITSGSNATTPGKVDVMQSSWFCSDAGANDTYACNLSPAATGYVTGTMYHFKANTANTGAATVDFNSLGPIGIKKMAGAISTELADNDIRAGQWVSMIYDGTNMEMTSQVGNASLTGTFVDAEVPGGDINSSNQAYTLAHAPSPAASLQLYLNGQLLIAGGADYTLATGDDITMVGTPQTGDKLIANYRY